MLDIVQSANRNPGIAGIIYAILKSDIDAWPAFTADTKNYTGDFTLVATKVWSKMEVSRIAGEFTTAQENAGNSDNPSKTETVTAFVPGIDGVTSKKLEEGEGKDWVLLTPILGSCATDDTPKYRVLGDKCVGLELVSTYSDDGSKMGYTCVFTGPQNGMPAIYSGTIAQ